jgi:hypothetical protein
MSYTFFDVSKKDEKKLSNKSMLGQRQKEIDYGG